jgi:serine protease Do
MKRQIKQILALSVFAATCMGVGMGLSHYWVASAQEDKPVTVDMKGADRMPPIAEVAEKLNPTVVAITNTSYVKSRRGDNFGGFFDGEDPFDFFFGPGRTPRRTPKGNDEEQRVQGFGSGVIISSSGEILTNRHVIEGANGGDSAELEVKLADGKTYKAKVLGKDKDVDIALLKIEAEHLPYAQLGDSDQARVGEWVVAIGNPLALEHTVTQGIISAKGRSARLVGDPTALESYLQTDAAINRGNSGGPLLNLRGEVIGINTAINPNGQNIGFAVPINLVKRTLKDLRAGRPVSRGFLGVRPVDLDKAFQDALGVREGVVVDEVTKGQAADKAGVHRLDVITSVDGVKIKSPEDLVQAVASHRAGDGVRLSIFREGKSKDLTVVLGDRKDANADANGENTESQPEKGNDKTSKVDLLKSYGINVEALTPANRHQYGIPETAKGVVVTDVSVRSVAAEKNMRPGMLVVAVGTRSVSNLSEFNAEVKKANGKPLLLQVVLGFDRGKPVTTTLALPAK